MERILNPPWYLISLFDTLQVQKRTFNAPYTYILYRKGMGYDLKM